MIFGVFRAPRARYGVGCYPGEAEAGQRLHFVAADEAARGIVPRLVLDDACHLRAAVEIHPTRHDGVDRGGRVPHVVAADLSRGVGESLRKFRRSRN